MILALALATTFVYNFPTKAIDYRVQLAFDGYIPILGGTEGKVDAEVQLAVRSEGPDKEGKPQVSSDLTAFKAKMDGETLPFTIDNVKQFFPKTTVSIESYGKVLKTNAPDLTLPVRLPGLDVKRFPETTFLPVEFPAEGYELGKTFTYKKPFGDSEVQYEVTPTSLQGNTLTLKLKLHQEFKTQEDEAKNLVTNPKDAFYDVSTVVDGTGEAVFDPTAGRLLKMVISASSESDASKIKKKPANEKPEHRTLKTTVTVTKLSISGT